MPNTSLLKSTIEKLGGTVEKIDETHERKTADFLVFFEDESYIVEEKNIEPSDDSDGVIKKFFQSR